jgi:hypothetical protein
LRTRCCDHGGCTLINGFRQQQIDLAELVASKARAREVFALDQQPFDSKRSRKARRILKGRWQQRHA